MINIHAVPLTEGGRLRYCGATDWIISRVDTAIFEKDLSDCEVSTALPYPVAYELLEETVLVTSWLFR